MICVRPKNTPRNNGNRTLRRKAMNECMKSKKARLESFQGKWTKYDIVKPEDLADSGFYYGDSKDRVVCAYCDVKLINWQPGDTPYSEHFKWSPSCPMLHGQVEVGNREKYDVSDSDLFLPDDPPEATGDDPSAAMEIAISFVRNLGFSDALIQVATEKVKSSGHPVTTRLLLDTVHEFEQCRGTIRDVVAKYVNPDTQKLKDENKRLKSRCLTCHKNVATILVLPCRHVVCCTMCKDKNKICPRCNANIRGTIKTFLA